MKICPFIVSVIRRTFCGHISAGVWPAVCITIFISAGAALAGSALNCGVFSGTAAFPAGLWLIALIAVSYTLSVSGCVPVVISLVGHLSWWDKAVLVKTY